MWLREERIQSKRERTYISEIAKRIFQLRLSYSECQSVLRVKLRKARISESESEECMNA